MLKRFKTELTSCYLNTLNLPFVGRFIFFAFFQIIFKKSVDCIVLKCYNIIVREIPLTIKKGEKYETKKGKEKTTQKEENESNL